MKRLAPAWLTACLALAVAAPALASGAYLADLTVRELGYDTGLRIQVYYQPDLVALPEKAGHVFVVYADSAQGRGAFFIPSDLALEVGDRQVYRVEVEQASDFVGQNLGGRLRPGDSMLGFVVAPHLLRVGEMLPDHPESLVVRYAQQRASFRPATETERARWEDSLGGGRLMAGLNAWWEWDQIAAEAPPLNEGEARFFAERIFPGQGQALLEGGVDPTALRNAILRVGERKLISEPATQRVAPGYPTAARQAGAEGLVIALAYVSERGTVEDASILASDTVHLLNVAALEAAMDWRFVPAGSDGGTPQDGWRLIPFQFQLREGAAAAPMGAVTADMQDTPPRLLKRVDAVYPDKARRSRITGTVVYRVTVSAEGKLKQTRLVQSVDPLLDDAALHAVEKSLYSPARKGGEAVEGEMDVVYTFGSEP